MKTKTSNKLVSSLVIFVLAISLGIAGWINTTRAAVAAINGANGGDIILIDTSSQGVTPAWTTLSGPFITENAVGMVGAGSHTINLPSGWEFNTAQNATIALSTSGEGSTDLTLASTTITPSATTITFTVTAMSTSAKASLIFSNIQVRPTGTVLSSSYMSHTGTINFGKEVSNWGTLTTVHGAGAKYIIINPTDGTAGDSIPVTVQLEDQFGNLVIIGADKDKDVTLNTDGSATGGGVVDIVNGTGSLNISDLVPQTVHLSLTDSGETGFLTTSTQNVIFAPHPQRYWVGGTGNWSDTAHWSATSGDPLGGADVPTSSDNVFIDANSGFDSGEAGSVEIKNAGLGYVVGYDVLVSGGNGDWNLYIAEVGENGEVVAFFVDNPGPGTGYSIGNDVATSDLEGETGSGFTVSLSGKILLDEDAHMNEFTSSVGRSYTIDGDNSYHFYVSGSLTLESGLTFNNGVYLYLAATTAGKTITTNGSVINRLDIKGTGSWILQDNLVITGFFIGQESGTTNVTFDANSHNVTAKYFNFYATANSTPTIIMGSGTWEVTGNQNDTPVYPYNWFVWENGGTVTFIPGNSTIKFTDTTDIAKNIYSAGKTYNNIWFAGASSGEAAICYSNAFNDFKIDAGRTINFCNSPTQTVKSFTAIGTALNPIIFTDPDQNGWTISAPSGTVSSDYLNLSYSTATGGATFYAGANSVGADLTDGGTNTGWIFTAAPDTNPPTPNPPIITTSNISQTSITWTLSTGTDVGSGLNATPYGFATVTNGPYTFQDTTTLVDSNLSCGTSYTKYGVLKDVLDNQTTEGSATVSTSACTVVRNRSSGSYIRPFITIPTIISGCDNRATGFSTTTGQSCATNSTTTVTTTTTYNFGTVTLKNGSKGEAVKELQKFLNVQLSSELIVDNILGPKTTTVIKKWQKENGLIADGIVGPITHAALLTASIPSTIDPTFPVSSSPDTSSISSPSSNTSSPNTSSISSPSSIDPTFPVSSSPDTSSISVPSATNDISVLSGPLSSLSSLSVSDTSFSYSLGSTITIISPKGGDILYWGSTYKILWNTTGDVPIVDITTTHVPSSYIASSIPNTNYYYWTVPTDLAQGQWQIRITSPTGDNARPIDDSGYFTIAKPLPPH